MKRIISFFLILVICFSFVNITRADSKMNDDILKALQDGRVSCNENYIVVISNNDMYLLDKNSKEFRYMGKLDSNDDKLDLSKKIYIQSDEYDIYIIADDKLYALATEEFSYEPNGDTEKNNYIMNKLCDGISSKLESYKDYEISYENFVVDQDVIFFPFVHGKETGFLFLDLTEGTTDIRICSNEGKIFGERFKLSGRVIYYPFMKNDGKLSYLQLDSDYKFVIKDLNIKVNSQAKVQLLYDEENQETEIIADDDVILINSDNEVISRFVDNSKYKFINFDKYVALDENLKISKKYFYEYLVKMSDVLFDDYFDKYKFVIKYGNGFIKTKENLDDQMDCDMLLLPSNLDKSSYEKQGAFLDLSQYPEIMKRVDKMYPYIKDTIIKDGKILYIPKNVYTYGALGISNFSLNLNIWKKLGYSIDDIPTTYAEFVDVLDDIYENKAEILREKKIALYFGRMFLSEELKMMILNDITTSYAKGKNVKFNSDEVKQLIEKINNSKYLSKKNKESIEEEIFNSYHSLFTKSEDVMDIPYGTKRIYLSVQKGGDSYVYADCDLIAINANSKYKQESIDILIDILDRLSDRMKAYIYTDYNKDYALSIGDAYTEEYAKKNIEDTKYDIIQSESRGKYAYTSNKATKELISYYENINNIRSNPEYGLNSEEINEFKENSDKMVISGTNNIYLGEESEYSDDLQKFFSDENSSLKFLDKLQDTIQKR